MRWDCFLGFPGCALAGESWSAGLLRATRLQVVWILPPCFPPAVLTVAWFCFHPADVEWHLPRAGWSWHGCVSPHPGPAGPVPAPARGARQKVLKSQWTCPVLPRTQGRGWLWGALLVQKEVTRPVHLTLAPSLKTPLLQIWPKFPSPQPHLITLPIASLQPGRVSKTPSFSHRITLVGAFPFSRNVHPSALPWHLPAYCPGLRSIVAS